MKLTSTLLSILICVPLSGAFCQLAVTPNQTAAVLAAKLAGPGITITSPTLTCPALANGKFISTSTPLGLDSGIILTTGRAANTAGPESFLASTNNGAAGDPALTTLAGAATHDACTLEFDFVPNGDTISFNYVFGSEEYINSVCGIYNDAFAFFISGPGITGTQNMALIPGTSIPVTVNSINNGIPGPGYSIATCNSMGPGSPFTSLYSSNIGGTQLTYRGYTVPMRAYHSVTPCSTYHLKMSVADASNYLYDSGVFIEAGSLKTNVYHFDHTDSLGNTIAGVPHTIVKGCNAASVKVISSHTSSSPQVVHLSYGGTALRGTDYTGPNDATILPGDTSVIFNIAGLPTAITGPQTIQVYLQSPFSCGGYVDTVTFTLLDSPTANILTPDTAICVGQSFSLRSSGTAALAYNWSPASSVSSASAANPIATPLTTTTYTLTATLAAAGCPPINRHVHVTVNTNSVTILTPDTAICNGATMTIRVAPNVAGTTYSWSPATALSSASVMEPIAHPSATTTYTLTAIDPVTGCPGTDDITITIFTPVAAILTPDTSICTNDTFQLRASGAPGMTFSWTPAFSLNNASLQNPIAAPKMTTTYSMTATIPGTPCMVTDAVTVTIIPPVIANAGQGQSICASVPINLKGLPSGVKYSYRWDGPSGFFSNMQNSFVGEGTAMNSGTYTLTVTDNTTTCFGKDTVDILVNTTTVKLTNVTPSQTIPLGSSIQLNADNARYYYWTPTNGSLNNPNINNPVATPTEKTTYIVYGISQEGCRDTATVIIDVDYTNQDFIPSAFTPNGDGLNDIFAPQGLKFSKLTEFKIFNRWGQQVFSSDNVKNGWDGTFNGQPADMGVYYYMISAGKPDGEQVYYKGEVTLIR